MPDESALPPAYSEVFTGTTSAAKPPLELAAGQRRLIERRTHLATLAAVVAPAVGLVRELQDSGQAGETDDPLDVLVARSVSLLMEGQRCLESVIEMRGQLQRVNDRDETDWARKRHADQLGIATTDDISGRPDIADKGSLDAVARGSPLWSEASSASAGFDQQRSAGLLPSPTLTAPRMHPSVAVSMPPRCSTRSPDSPETISSFAPSSFYSAWFGSNRSSISVPPSPVTAQDSLRNLTGARAANASLLNGGSSALEERAMLAWDANYSGLRHGRRQSKQPSLSESFGRQAAGSRDDRTNIERDVPPQANVSARDRLLGILGGRGMSKDEQ